MSGRIRRRNHLLIGNHNGAAPITSPRIEACERVVVFHGRQIDFVANPQIDGQLRRDFPVVLEKAPDVANALIVPAGRNIATAAERYAEQVVGKSLARSCRTGRVSGREPVKRESARPLSRRGQILLPAAVTESGLECVLAANHGDVRRVVPVVRNIREREAPARQSGKARVAQIGKGWKQVGDPLAEPLNPGLGRPVGPVGNDVWIADVIEGPRKGNARLQYGCRAEVVEPVQHGADAGRVLQVCPGVVGRLREAAIRPHTEREQLRVLRVTEIDRVVGVDLMIHLGRVVVEIIIDTRIVDEVVAETRQVGFGDPVQKQASG